MEHLALDEPGDGLEADVGVGPHVQPRAGLQHGRARRTVLPPTSAVRLSPSSSAGAAAVAVASTAAVSSGATGPLTRRE